MEASSVTRRVLTRADFRRWAWWQLPWLLRFYVGVVSLLFRAFPASFAGPAIGTGLHALTWAVAVAICEQVGRRGQQILIMGGIKLTDPTVRLADQEFNREALVADFAEFDLSILI